MLYSWEQTLNEIEKQLKRIANALEQESAKHGQWQHGRWQSVTKPTDSINGFRCSVCHRLAYSASKFCPHCGAEMDNLWEVKFKGE